MGGRLDGKIAIVTGASRGLGEGIARRLAAEGAATVVSGRNDAQGQAVVEAIRASGGRAAWTRADVGRPGDCAALIEFAVREFGGLDILVNNAAHLGAIPYEEITPEEWTEVFDVNVRGAFLLIRAAIPHLRKRGGGSVVNIGTTNHLYPSLGRASYCCSKAALLTLTRAIARECAPDHIRANWITVGWVATPREIELRDQTHGDGKSYLERVAKERHPMGRLETPEDIAAGVVFLCSDEASHVTACQMYISGGLLVCD
jgi:NAD(P)-dependent dehydrogenase (short-subunit alcohol dehydrogenase family)